ncbi:hypothetical protein [Bradyrhizobium sp. STM 3561]|uniref:hypothetical protein n=1 Tax=unclassified Bradyrhizobium TaxID=2631580 RepID=UPI00388EF760
MVRATDAADDHRLFAASRPHDEAAGEKSRGPECARRSRLRFDHSVPKAKRERKRRDRKRPERGLIFGEAPFNELTFDIRQARLQQATIAVDDVTVSTNAGQLFIEHPERS